MKPKNFFYLVAVVMCAMLFGREAHAYLSKKQAKALYKEAQTLMKVDRTAALQVLGKMMLRTRPRSWWNRRARRLVRRLKGSVREVRRDARAWYGDTRGSFKRPAEPCGSIARVTGLLKKHNLPNGNVLQLYKHYCMQRPSGARLRFPVKVLVLDRDKVGVRQCRVYVGKRYLGWTDAFGSYAGTFPGQVGSIVRLRVVGPGRKNQKALLFRLELQKGPGGTTTPKPLKMDAKLRKR